MKKRHMKRSGRRLLITLTGALLSLVLIFRVIPRLVPWTGRSAADALVWSMQIEDRRGEVLQVMPVDESGLRRTFLPLEEIPRELRRVVRRSEDRRFFLHPGFDLPSLFRAGRDYMKKEGPSGGGSTISMQLARILVPRESGVPVTPGLKAREIFQALQIESRYSKGEILEMYMNLVPFGRNIEGYPAASRLFFGRDLRDLTPRQMCVLAVIPRSPSRYDPFLFPVENQEAAGRLSAAVLDHEDTRAGVRAVPTPEVRRGGPAPWPFEAPHFVSGLLTRSGTWPAAMRTGLRPVRTSLDLMLQKEAAALLKYHVDLADDFRISNGAMLLADPETMEILVYLGSSDFHDEENSGQIDGVVMLREPGSTLKPLLYATALDMGWTAATILPDIPMEFGDRFIYTPMNYDQQFHGPVRLRQALAASLNIPAVYTLERLGVERFIDSLAEAGFASLEQQREQLGVSLAVGGGEVSLAELVQGYGGLYAGGIVRPLRFLPADESPGSRIWSLDSADIITDIISSSDDRVMTFGRAGPVRFDYPAAIKTGTSNQFNNIWAVGFTSDLIGAVWMGNFDGSTVIAAPGSSLPATVLHESFDRWSDKDDIHVHSDLETRTICSISGMAATRLCPYTMEEVFAWGSAPGECDWHQESPEGVRLSFPQEYQSWARLYGYGLEFAESGGAAILHPVEGAVYYAGGVIRLSLTGTGTGRLRADGRLLYEGSLPAEVLWPVETGTITFTLEQEGPTVSRRIEVR